MYGAGTLPLGEPSVQSTPRNLPYSRRFFQPFGVFRIVHRCPSETVPSRRLHALADSQPCKPERVEAYCARGYAGQLHTLSGNENFASSRFQGFREITSREETERPPDRLCAISHTSSLL